jgi:hypothetical protein
MAHRKLKKVPTILYSFYQRIVFPIANLIF